MLGLGALFAALAALPRALFACALVSLATLALFAREPEVPFADDA
jgi:hypothetical protein